MTTTESSIAHLLLKNEIEEFLYQEAELLDERNLEDWLDLLTDDIRYWMPMRRNVKSSELDREFTREGQDISWFDEGKETLEHRVKQILTGVHWAEEPLQGRRGPVGCSFWSHEFYRTDRSRGFVRGYSFEAIRGFGPVQTALWGMIRGFLPWGEGHHQKFARLYDHTASLIAITEDLPDETHTVTLDPELTDSHGIPAPRVTYRLSDNSRKMLAHAVERAKEALTAAGAVETSAEPLFREAGWHLMGTARMGKDPTTSVVNEWGQAHDVKNLFIVDGSVFVTAGAVNPTSTIQALALYVADSIKKNIETLFDSA